MALTPRTLPGFTPVISAPKKAPTPSLSETFTAGFALENDLIAGVELLTRPLFEDQQDFDFKSRAASVPSIVNNYANSFIGVKSDKQFDYVLGKINAELEAKTVLGNSGPAGVVAALTAGILSPTMFIPVVGTTAKGIRAVTQGAGFGAVAGGVQSSMLLASQETRESSDVAFDVAAGAIIGGLLGGAIGHLNTAANTRIVANLEKGEEFEYDNIQPVTGSTTEPTKTKGDLGAASNQVTNPGKLLGLAGSEIPIDFISKIFGKFSESPVVQAIQQEGSLTARKTAWQLSNAGLEAQMNKHGIATAPGGTVENRTQVWFGNFAEALKGTQSSYTKYLHERPKDSIRLSRAAFYEEIADVMDQGAKYIGGNKQAQEAAVHINKVLYEPITKAAVEATLLTEKEVTKVVGDTSYLNRVFNSGLIDTDKPDFIEFLAINSEARFQENFAKDIAKYNKGELRTAELIKTLDLDAEGVLKQQETLAREQEILETLPAQTQVDSIKELKQKARAIRKTTKNKLTLDPKKEKKLASIRDKIAKIQEKGGAALIDLQTKQATINRQTRNTRKAIGALAGAQSKKLLLRDKIETKQLNSLRILNRKAIAVQRDIDKFAPKVLRARLTKLQKALSRTQGVLTRGNKRLNKLIEEQDTIAIKQAEELQAARTIKLNKLNARLTDVEDLANNSTQLKDLANSIFEQVTEVTNDLNSKRAVRINKLEAQIAQLNPNAVAGVKKSLQDALENLRSKLEDKFRNLGTGEFGVEDIDIKKGKANFKALARKSAIDTVAAIQNTHNRLPMVDMMQGKRGPALARSLNIASNAEVTLASGKKVALKKWLVRDIEDLMMIYTRSMSGDIEMAKAFDGDVNAAKVLDDIDLEFVEKQTEVQQNNKLTDKEKTKKIFKLSKEQKRTVASLQGMIARIRHNRGIPSNAGGAAHRLAKVAANINTARYMGGVTIASIPDVGRPVFRYGLLNTFEAAFKPMINGFKELRISSREAQLAGPATDIVTHQTSRALSEVFEQNGRAYSDNIVGKSVIGIERGIEFASAKIGIVAGFDFFNQYMKQFSSIVANAEFLNSMQIVVENKSIPRLHNKAQTFLNKTGLDSARVQKIWALVNESDGGGKINGVWLPNTESWTNPKVYEAVGLDLTEATEMVHSYRAALAGELNATIVTPGLERPLWMDSKSLSLRLLGQFKSFLFASNTKTVMAGLQKADMAVVNSTMISLAFGAFSYYIYAMTVGGATQKKMEKLSWEGWADEAISRSGVLGSLHLVQDVLETIPATQGATTVSENLSARRGGRGLLGQTLGPTYDLLKTVSRVIADADSPTQSTTHAIRKLLPYQNVFWLRQLFFDTLEDKTNSLLTLPSRR